MGHFVSGVFVPSLVCDGFEKSRSFPGGAISPSFVASELCMSANPHRCFTRVYVRRYVDTGGSGATGVYGSGNLNKAHNCKNSLRKPRGVSISPIQSIK